MFIFNKSHYKFRRFFCDPIDSFLMLFKYFTITLHNTKDISIHKICTIKICIQVQVLIESAMFIGQIFLFMGGAANLVNIKYCRCGACEKLINQSILSHTSISLYIVHFLHFIFLINEISQNILMNSSDNRIMRVRELNYNH